MWPCVPALQKVNGVWPGGVEKTYGDLKGGKWSTEHFKSVGEAFGGPGQVVWTCARPQRT